VNHWRVDLDNDSRSRETWLAAAAAHLSFVWSLHNILHFIFCIVTLCIKGNSPPSVTHPVFFFSSVAQTIQNPSFGIFKYTWSPYFRFLEIYELGARGVNCGSTDFYFSFNRITYCFTFLSHYLCLIFYLIFSLPTRNSE